MSHLHSHAHVSELIYRAIRLAICPDYEHPRDSQGRFVSRVKAKARQLRSELQAQSNIPLAEAIEAIRSMPIRPEEGRERA